MNSCAIVTLSCFPNIFAQFAASVSAYEHGRRKIVVASGEMQHGLARWEFARGPEPFCFARNANIGMRMAAPDDVFLVNDDVRFTSLGSIAMLQMVAYSSDTYGIVSPQFLGQVGNPLQKRSTKISDITISDDRLCFTGVYIKRSVLDRVGELDERFVSSRGIPSGTCEDDDMCLRVKQAGLQLVVTSRVVMQHGYGRDNASASFNRVGRYEEVAEEMRGKFAEKWGHRP